MLTNGVGTPSKGVFEPILSNPKATGFLRKERGMSEAAAFEALPVKMEVAAGAFGPISHHHLATVYNPL
jgi:hypothetical protein